MDAADVEELQAELVQPVEVAEVVDELAVGRLVVNEAERAARIAAADARAVEAEVLEGAAAVVVENEDHPPVLSQAPAPLPSPRPPSFKQIDPEIALLRAQLVQSEQARRDLEDARLCAICLSEELNCWFVPCGHQVRSPL